MDKENKIRISAYLSPKWREELSKQADTEGCSESALVARSVMTYLELRRKGTL